jgi:hypothetical protein
MFFCRDFNSTSQDDFIRGVDDVVNRIVIDYSFNRFGDLQLDFLVNGRNNVKNDNTSIFSKGNAVGDFCFVCHDN